MILLFSITVAVLFGAGCYLMLKHDLIRLLIGMVLIGNAANLFIMATGITRGPAPIHPISGKVADSIVQSMTLTAIVISFSVSALVLALIFRLYGSHASTSLDSIARSEESQVKQDEAGDLE